MSAIRRITKEYAELQATSVEGAEITPSENNMFHWVSSFNFHSSLRTDLMI